MIIINILQTFWISFWGISKAIISLIIELLPTINLLNDIAGAFSWKAILAYYIGIPTAVITIIIFLIKILKKKGLL